MKKCNYWSYTKTGAWELAINHFHNKKIVCQNHHSEPIFSLLYKPSNNGYYIKQLLLCCIGHYSYYHSLISALGE